MGNQGYRVTRTFVGRAKGQSRAHAWVGALGFVLVVFTLAARPAAAQFGPPPEQQVFHQNTTVFRYNPLGLITFGEMGYRHRLFAAPESAVLRNNWASAGLSYALSPGFGRVGPRVEIQPLSILSVWAAYELVGWFGSFDYITSYSNLESAAAAGWSDTALGDQSEAGLNYALSGSQLWLGANFQIKVGPVALINQFRATRYDYDLRDTDKVFFDIFFDTLAADESWAVSNDLSLMALIPNLGRGTLLAGARWTHTQAFFPDDVRGADTRSAIAQDRVGPFLGFRVFTDDQARFNAPTVFALFQWYGRHPYRTGQDVSQALPYMLVGFSFQGDLLADELQTEPDTWVEDPNVDVVNEAEVEAEASADAEVEAEAEASVDAEVEAEASVDAEVEAEADAVSDED